VGSSISTTRARAAIARQISTTCRAPIGSRPTSASGSISGWPNSASTARASLRASRWSKTPRREGSAPITTFSATLRCGKTDSSWWMSAIPRARASLGERGA
jgi:hypothetical protein